MKSLPRDSSRGVPGKDGRQRRSLFLAIDSQAMRFLKSAPAGAAQVAETERWLKTTNLSLPVPDQRKPGSCTILVRNPEAIESPYGDRQPERSRRPGVPK